MLQEEQCRTFTYEEDGISKVILLIKETTIIIIYSIEQGAADCKPTVGYWSPHIGLSGEFSFLSEGLQKYFSEVALNIYITKENLTDASDSN